MIPAHAADTVDAASYIDADGNGTVDHLKWTFGGQLDPGGCVYDPADWSVDNAQSITNLTITGFNLLDPEGNGNGACDETDVFLYISVTADAGALGSTILPTVTYTNGGSNNLVLDVFGNVATKSAVAHTDGASGEVLSNTMFDTNANGKIDRIVVTVDNPTGGIGHAYGTAGWGVTDNGNAVTVSTVSINGTTTADPQTYHIDLDETDTDLTVDTLNTDLLVSYTPQGLGLGTEYKLGTSEFLSLTATNPTDSAAPAPVTATFYDGDDDGDLDLITVVWSEDINGIADATASGEWELTSASDFAGLPAGEGTVECNDGAAGVNECDYNFTTTTKKTDAGDLTLVYTAGTVNDGTNIAASATFTASSTPAFTDAAAPFPSLAEFFDGNGDGKVDLITSTWSEPLVAVANGSTDWDVSSAGSQFVSLSEGAVECNSGSAASNQCDYNFTTTTVKTDVGDLTLDYTAGTSIQDSAGNTAISANLDSASTPTLDDKTAPVIKDFTYQDSTSDDGKIDDFLLTFSETLDANSILAANDLIFSNVGDFTGAAFGTDNADQGAASATATVTLGTPATAVDTFDDSGNTAITSQNNFSLEDAGGNINNTLGAQSQATVTDGTAPVIKDFNYQDTDGDGSIDQFVVTFSETAVAASNLGPDDFAFSNVGDFTTAAFGAVDTDQITTSTTTATIVLGTESSVQDTAEDSGNIAVDTQNAGTQYRLDDAAGNTQSAYITQSHATFTDGAAPVPTTATFFDPDVDGLLDLITVVWSEDLTAIANGASEWAISSAANFAALVEGTVECNSGVAGTNECDYNFTTTTAKTDVGDLSLAYTAGTVSDGTSAAVSATFTSASTPAFTDGAAPAFISVAADSDTNVNIVMTEPVDAGTLTFGAASDWNATGLTSAAVAESSGTIDVTVGSLGDTAFTATDFAFSTSGGVIEDAATNATPSFTSKAIADAQAPTITAGNLTADEAACTGTSGECIVGDVMTFVWDNSAGGDDNSDVSTVTADITTFGGSATQTLFDDGTNGDTTASDSFYAYSYTVVADDDDGTYTFTITATDTSTNAATSASSTDTAPVDNIPPVIGTAGVLAITLDVDSDTTAEVGDEVSYTDLVVGSADGDTITIDLSTLTGDPVATSAGSPHTVLPGILNNLLAFTEKAVDNAGNETTGLVVAIDVDNASGSGFNSAAVAPASLVASAITHTAITFDPTLDLPIDGKIEIVYPTGFDVSGATTISDLTGIDGTFTLGISGQTITLTRDSDGTILTGGTTATLSVNTIVNPTTAGTTGTFTLSTKTAANITLSSIATLPGAVITPVPTPSSSGGGGGGGGSSSGGGGGGGGSYLAQTIADADSDASAEGEASVHGAAPASIAAFADTFGHWAEAYIKKIADLGIVEGKTPTEYAPNDNISRAELLKIAVNSFDYTLDELISQNPLPDVEVDAWYAPYVKSAFENGIIYGFDSGLDPNAAASRGMAVTILVKAAGFADVEQSFFQNYSSNESYNYAHFPDVLIDAYYAPFVAYLYDLGVIDGYDDGSFGAGNSITRAEIAKIVVNILDIYIPVSAEEAAEDDTTQEPEEPASEDVQMMDGQGL